MNEYLTYIIAHFDHPWSQISVLVTLLIVTVADPQEKSEKYI